ncbi:MAG: TonB-dependent receptor [Acidobacteria bacterium]|nr:TonB-dependent receptor [Acidobacteriota bacterium]
MITSWLCVVLWAGPAVALQQTTPQTPAPSAVITVVDAATGAPVADALVRMRLGGTEGAANETAGSDAHTDTQGMARFAGLPPGPYTLTVSTVGYIFVRREEALTPDATLVLTVPLSEGTGRYQDEVTVTANAMRTSEIGVASQMELGSAALQDLRGVASDDPMRAIQTLPGVATGDDFQAEFSVRGSAFRHVGIVIDGVQAPLLLHAVRGRDDTGSVAMINSDVLERASLLAGPHPQRHGDWLGATLEFGVREGSRDRVQLRGAVSGTSASTVIEGPLTPSRRGAWLVSMRKSYVDWLIRKLDPDISSTIGFADAQSVLSYDLTDRQQMRLMLIGGQAVYREQETSVANGLSRAVSTGGLASLSWRYAGETVLWSQRLSASVSTFANTGLRGQNLGDGTTSSYTWRTDVLRTLGRAWTVETGARYEANAQNQTLRRYTTTSAGGLRVTAARDFKADTALSSVWGQVGGRTATAGIAVGARVSHDSHSGDRWVSPWLLGEYSGGRLSVRASVGASHQRPSLEQTLASLDPLRTESARSADVSLDLRLGAASHLQITPFIRKDRDGLRPTLEDRAVDGQRVLGSRFPVYASRLNGQTRGVDVLLQRQAPRGLTGWVSYTWAHTAYDDTVSGEHFDGDYDQRHTINVFLSRRLSYRSAVNAKLRLGSNVPLVGYFAGTTNALRLSDLRNQVRLPWYVRLDLRANRTFTFARRRVTFFVEVVNVLGRRNLGQSDGFSRSTLEALFYTEHLIPRVPSAGFLIEF